jgi:MmyB-like transcription regulator ligand binding domain
MRPHPAMVLSRTMDLLAANPAALRLYTGMEDWPAKHRNLARYIFLHPAARTLFDSWNTQIRGCDAASAQVRSRCLRAKSIVAAICRIRSSTTREPWPAS